MAQENFINIKLAQDLQCRKKKSDLHAIFRNGKKQRIKYYTNMEIFIHCLNKSFSKKEYIIN